MDKAYYLNISIINEDKKMSINYYNENAIDFYNGTVNADMSSTCDKFLSFVKAEGKILDVGCGSGRDSLYFLNKGFDVVSMDASEEMVKMSSELTGQETLQMRFDEIEFVEEFDGVWACASLLHVAISDLPDVLKKIRKAMKTDGIFFSSFKYGEGEVERDGRRFSNFTEDSVRDLMSGFRVVEVWVTEDVRPGREGERWVNVLVRK